MYNTYNRKDRVEKTTIYKVQDRVPRVKTIMQFYMTVLNSNLPPKLKWPFLIYNQKARDINILQNIEIGFKFTTEDLVHVIQ